MPVPDYEAPTKQYRHALPTSLIEKIDQLRKRHQDHPEITVFRQNTIRFALELLLALEEAIF